MSDPTINCCAAHKEEFMSQQARKKTNKRLRLNELDHRLNCSIIGTCVTLAELRKVRQKAKLFLDENIDDYNLHRLFVGMAEKKSYANKRLQKLLDQKYKPIISKFSKVHTQEGLNELWEQAVKKGDIAGAFWALLTHPDSEKKLTDKVYGEVHMLSHISGASIRVDLQELTILRQENKELKAQQVEVIIKNKKHLYEKEALIRKQDKQLKKLQLEVNALKVAASAPSIEQITPDTDETIINEVSYLSSKLHFSNSKLMRLEQKSAITFAKNEALEKQQVSLKAQLEQTREDNASLENLLDQYLNPLIDNQCQSGSCCDNNLDGKRILYVGGRDRQCSHFRALTEQNNGSFIHHDGGKSDGSRKLYSTLAQADVVMCPLDCISHEAMINVKRYCKNTAKPLIMMPRSSYSAFSKGLSKIPQ